MGLLVAWLPLLVFVGLIFTSIVRTMVLGLTLPPSLRHASAPGVCGRCGYAFGPGHGDRCSECGTPWVVAGVLTRPLVRNMRPKASSVIAAWLMTMIVVAVFLIGALTDAFNNPSASSSNVTAAVVLTTLAVWIGVVIAGIVLILRRRAKIFASPVRETSPVEDG